MRFVRISMALLLWFSDSFTHLASMLETRKKYRWDRIAWVGGVIVLVALGLAAWIAPASNASEDMERLSFPNSPDSEFEDSPDDSKADLATLQEDLSADNNPVQNSIEDQEEIKPCSCNRHVLKLPKNPYTDHRKAARNLPNSFFVKNKNELNAGKRNGKLVEVKDGRGYHVTALTHSYAVLLPEVAKLLKDMGNAFADELAHTSSAGTRFRVTSLTRTAQQQDRLGRKNYNAIEEASTHSYGASFDIAYTDRPDNESDCSAPTRAMQKVLSDFQKRGRIYVIPEQNCMHITLRP